MLEIGKKFLMPGCAYLSFMLGPKVVRFKCNVLRFDVPITRMMSLEVIAEEE